MEQNITKNLNNLTRMLGADRLLTPEDVTAILTGIMQILAEYKKGTEGINEETKQVVNTLLEQVIKYNNEAITDFKTEADKAHGERVKELETLLKDIETMILDVEVLASNVRDGKDADEERVIGEVISRIKIDPTVITVSAQEIRDKLASLKDEERLDKSAIKGLEKILMQKDLDYAIATLQQQTSFLINKGGLKTVSHDASLSGDGTPENPLKVESTSGLTLETDGTPNGDQTLLNLVAGTNMTLTDDGNGNITFDATGGAGSPGGSNTQLQYNNSGSFGGISGATTNGTAVTYTTGNLIGADVKASGSGGLSILSNAGTQTALFGASGGANSTFYGGMKGDYLTASEILITDASKNIVSAPVATYPSLTELSYVKGVTSAIQTQLNAKVDDGAVTTSGLTMVTSRILGRTTAATGAIEELTAGSSLSLSAGSLNTIQDIRTSASPEFTAVNIGHATDTTLSRVSAGVIAVEGVTIATASNTLTLSNKSVSGALNLEENASIALDPAASADGKYTGITRTGTAGAALAFGDLVYLDPTDSRWELADANAAQGADGDSRGVLGICVLAAAADGDPTTILLYGTVRADTAFPTMTVNNQMYVSETAGDITGTQPTTTDVVIRVVGVALSADELLFNPSPDYITHT